MTYEEIRQNVMAYLKAKVDASDYAADPYRVFWPSDGLPGPEDSPDPFLVIGLNLNVDKKQAGMGSKATHRTCHVYLNFHVREGTGLKEVAKFEDWCDGLDIHTENKIVYRPVVSGGSEDTFKGWTQIPRILPFRVQCF